MGIYRAGPDKFLIDDPIPEPRDLEAN